MWILFQQSQNSSGGSGSFDCSVDDLYDDDSVFDSGDSAEGGFSDEDATETVDESAL